eukprot:CAMPEP_0183731628 /NCGR_PEP_ID=MMETSP0737-20130205/35993_1 /TAXON_ID=385413 /ORGANISM="Thalassiosira miniscula, Strain CCMP1093" /LENGTH=199 /DNA_ID=CAMNT_0025964409 /DNA_START=124 /DNA_END=723 /DNA_ORIENTATION=-
MAGTAAESTAVAPNHKPTNPLHLNHEKMSSPTEPTPSSTSSSSNLTHEDRIAIVRNHFAQKGYRVHSGLQFGCELVLYADSPGRVHSDFCVHVPETDDGQLDWRTLQTLVRSMPDLHKTLIVAHVREEEEELLLDDTTAVTTCDDSDCKGSSGDDGMDAPMFQKRYVVDELAIATEHAPFRHKNAPKGVGNQRKPQRGR